MIKLFHFLKGYLWIQVYGYSPERFFNLCSTHGIFLWNIQKSGNDYTLNMHKRAFFEIKPLLRKTGTHVKIVKKYGLPFLFPKIKKRGLFAAGLVFSFLSLIVSSFFVWSIDVEGNTLLTDEVVEAFLEEQGVWISTPKEKIEIEQLEQKLRDEFEQITWTSLQLNGTKLTVYIKENQYYSKEEVQEETEYLYGADMVADMDGVVVSIVTRQGNPVVKAGDSVKKGDVLVQGQIPIYRDDLTIKSIQMYEADADIMIQGTIPYEETIAFDYARKGYTGRSYKENFLQVLGKELHFSKSSQEYCYEDRIMEKKQLSLMKGVSFPIFYGHCTHFEYYPTEEKYTKQEAGEVLKKSFGKFIEGLEEKGVQIIEKDVTMNTIGSGCSLKGQLKVQKQVTMKIACEEMPVPAAESEQSDSDNGEIDGNGNDT